MLAILLEVFYNKMVKFNPDKVGLKLAENISVQVVSDHGSAHLWKSHYGNCYNGIATGV